MNCDVVGFLENVLLTAELHLLMGRPTVHLQRYKHVLYVFYRTCLYLLQGQRVTQDLTAKPTLSRPKP